MFGYIYETTLNDTGEKYIGQHHGEFDPEYLGSGARIKKLLQDGRRSALSVRFVTECLDQKDMDEKEQAAIKTAKDGGVALINIMPGGLGVNPKIMEAISLALKGRKKTKEHIAAMSASRKGRKCRNKRKPPTPETLVKMSLAQKGKKHSEDTRAKMSESQRRRPKPSAETRAKLAKTWAIRKAMLAEAAAQGISIGIHDISLTNRTRRKTKNANDNTDHPSPSRGLDVHAEVGDDQHQGLHRDPQTQGRLNPQGRP